MGKTITLDRDFIKPRDLQVVADTLHQGATVITPSDTGYSLLCRLGDKSAAQKIRTLKNLDKDHPFTVFCPDLSRLSLYAKVDNVQYRLLKQLYPGTFTCILPAGKEAPRLVQHEKRKTIGIRVPQESILRTVLEYYDDALMGVSVFGSDEPVAALYALDTAFSHNVDLLLDGGERPNLPSTVVDMTQMPPTVVRQGAGDFTPYL